MSRILIELFRLAALLGCGLSLAGLVLLVWFRVEFVMQQAPMGGGLDTRGGALTVLDGFKDPGIPFLLSALLFVACEIALRSTHKVSSAVQDDPDSLDTDSM